MVPVTIWKVLEVAEMVLSEAMTTFTEYPEPVAVDPGITQANSSVSAGKLAAMVAMGMPFCSSSRFTRPFCRLASAEKADQLIVRGEPLRPTVPATGSSMAKP